MFELMAVGPIIIFCLSGIGSALGCTFAAIPALAAMAKTDADHGKYIAVVSAPSSQFLYGFIGMTLLDRAQKSEVIDVYSGINIGLFLGFVMLFSACAQGLVGAASIKSMTIKPEIFGKGLALMGIIETFAVLSLILSKMIM